MLVPEALGEAKGVLEPDSELLMLSSAPLTTTLSRLDREGRVYDSVSNPSSLDPWIKDAEFAEDGSALLAGSVPYDHERAWVGMVDPEWNLVWERTLELGRVMHAEATRLPDGSAVLGFVTYVYTGGDEYSTVVLARLSDSGELLWQSSVTEPSGISGTAGRKHSLLSLTPDGHFSSWITKPRVRSVAPASS